MKITAVAVGTRGDVNPLVELGSEMVQKGHEFRILAQEECNISSFRRGCRTCHEISGDRL